MPSKKFGNNTKAQEARERKETVKKEKQEKEKKAKEDALWTETDKHVLSKEQRKKEQEDKKRQELERKKAAREALEREEQELKKAYAKNQPPPKITQAEIARTREIEEIAARQRKEQEDKREIEIEENINRVIALERANLGTAYIEARTVDDVIGHMGAIVSPDKHPEKRVKATYAAYEEKNLPQFREENPTLKLSQLKELIWKQWQKSPENPINQLPLVG